MLYLKSKKKTRNFSNREISFLNNFNNFSEFFAFSNAFSNLYNKVANFAEDVKSEDVKESSSEVKNEANEPVENPSETQSTQEKVGVESNQPDDSLSHLKPKTKENYTTEARKYNPYRTEPFWLKGKSLAIDNLERAARTPLGRSSKILKEELSPINGGLRLAEESYREDVDRLQDPKILQSVLQDKSRTGYRGFLAKAEVLAKKDAEVRTKRMQELKDNDSFFNPNLKDISVNTLTRVATRANNILLNRGWQNDKWSSYHVLDEMRRDRNVPESEREAINRILELYEGSGENWGENLPFFTAQNIPSPLTRKNKTSATA